MKTQVSFLALVPSTYTMVPPSQPSAHVPLHSEACEPVTQPRPRRRDSGLRSLQGLGSGDCPRAEGVVSVGFPPFPPRVLPAPPGSLGPRRELPAHEMPAIREPGGLVPSHLLPVQLSGLGGEGAAEGASHPPSLLEAEARRAGRAQKAVSTPFGPSARNQLREPLQLPPRPVLPGGASARHLH